MTTHTNCANKDGFVCRYCVKSIFGANTFKNTQMEDGRMRTLHIENETLQKLKALGAQLNRSPEATVRHLLNHFENESERDFQQSIGQYSGQVYLSGQAHERLFKNIQK